MSLFKQIEQDLIKALKEQDKQLLSLLRGLKSDLKYAQIEKGKDLSDQECIAVLSSCAKKRQQSIDGYKQGGRDDLVAKETFELEQIRKYLPQQLSEPEVEQIVKDAIAEAGVDSPQGMGKVMQIVMPRVKGRADGKLVNEIVKKLLVAK